MIRQRVKEADYLEINGSYEFLGTGFSKLDEKPNAQTKEKRYVNQKSSTQSITSYKWQEDFTTDQIVNDKAIEYLVYIGKTLKTGGDAETNHVKVDLDKPGTESNTFYARKRTVAIQVDSLPDNDGELGVEGAFLGVSDVVEGTFNTTTNTFTEGFTGKTLEFSYTATGTVTEISVDGITYDSTGHKFKNIPVNTTSFTFKDGSTTKTATLSESWNVA